MKYIMYVTFYILTDVFKILIISLFFLKSLYMQPYQNQLIPSDDPHQQLQNHLQHHENGCNDQCSHKMELNRMEMFYSELFLD